MRCEVTTKRNLKTNTENKTGNKVKYALLVFQGYKHSLTVPCESYSMYKDEFIDTRCIHMALTKQMLNRIILAFLEARRFIYSVEKMLACKTF